MGSVSAAVDLREFGSVLVGTTGRQQVGIDPHDRDRYQQSEPLQNRHVPCLYVLEILCS